MKKQSSLWLVAVVLVALVAGGAIYSRMGVESGEGYVTGTAPAGIELSGGRAGGRAPIQYAPIAAAIANTADAVLDPDRIPSNPTVEKGRAEMPISERAANRLRRQAKRTRFTDGVDAGYSVPPMLSPPGVTISNYQDGPDAEDNTGFSVPPDPEMAAGPDHLMTVVNSVFGIHDKVGGAATFIDADTFFSADPACPLGLFDPDVAYDEDAGRWIQSWDSSGTHACVGFSDDSDPFGTWFLYAIPTATGAEFFDYPHIGVGPECIGMGANIFIGGFVGSNVWCMEKADGYAGAPLTVVMGTTGFSSTPQFADLKGSDLTTTGPEHHIFTDDLFDGQTFGIFEWDALGVGGDPIEVATPGWVPGGGGFPIDTPMSGTAGTLQANDWRIQSKATQRNGSAWISATVSANPSGTGTVNCFQWAEVDVDANSVVQGGLVCPDTNIDPLRNAIFADIAANECGDAFAGFTRSQATDQPGTAICGRRGDTPLGSLRCGQGIQRGERDYDAFDGSPFRWGDYTSMATDPNGKDFWYFGEYSKDLDNGITNWGTNIGSIVTDCAVN
jgi:hypothetical protein